MRLKQNYPYLGLSWTVESAYGSPEMIRPVAAGAYELQVPYMMDTGIPQDFDSPNRFIDRSAHFSTIAFAERVGSEVVDFYSLLSLGKRIILQGRLADIPLANSQNNGIRIGASW